MKDMANPISRRSFDRDRRPTRSTGDWRRSQWLWLGVALVLTVGTGVGLVRVLLPASKPHAVSGVVRCSSGAGVVGVWIADNSMANWADWKPEPARPSVARYQHEILGHGYSAHVGCGGTPGGWAVDVRSPKIRATEVKLLCFDRPSDQRFKHCEVEK